MEVIRVKCKCGWEGAVVKGRIKAIYCPRCKNRIEVINPGPFPPGVTVESPSHKPRNYLIGKIILEILA